MKKRYKLVLNVDITDPKQPFPAGGDYMHLNRIQGVAKVLINSVTVWPGPEIVTVTLDKIVEKGEIE